MKGGKKIKGHDKCVSSGCDRPVLGLSTQRCSVGAALCLTCLCLCPSTRCTAGRCATLRTRAGSARWSRTSCPSLRRPTSARTTTSPSSTCPCPSSLTATPPPSCTTSTGSVWAGDAAVCGSLPLQPAPAACPCSLLLGLQRGTADPVNSATAGLTLCGWCAHCG